MNNNDFTERVKQAVNKGNVSKIIVKDKHGNQVVSLNTSVGIIGGLVAMGTVPWAVVATAIITAGTGCTVKIIKNNGEVINISDKFDTVTDKVGDIASNIKDSLKKRFNQ